MSIRDKILSAEDIVREAVEVPEWDVTLEVRGMTGAERTRIMALAMDSDGAGLDFQQVYPEIVIATTFDVDSGEQIFSPDDRVALMAKSAQAIDRIAMVGMRLSGFTKDAADEAGKDS